MSDKISARSCDIHQIPSTLNIQASPEVLSLVKLGISKSPMGTCLRLFTIMDKPLSIAEARELINKKAKEFFILCNKPTEEEFIKAYADMEKYQHIWEWLEPANYSHFITLVAYYNEKFNGVQAAINKLKYLYPDYKIACKYDYGNKYYIHEKWAELYVKQNNETKAFEHLKKATYFIFIDNVSYDGFEFFSFRGFSDYAWDDIKKNTICLAHPGTFNDPMDTILLRWNKYLMDIAADDTERKLRAIYQKVYDHIKARCFARNGDLPKHAPITEDVPVSKYQNIEEINPLMWAHYAHNHEGFCIKYKLPANVLRNEDEDNLVVTRVGMVSYEPTMNFANQTDFNVYKALFAKHDVWKYENEFRLVQFDANNEDNYKTIDIPEDAIQEIYLGLKCSDANREKMKLTLRNRNIKLFQMKASPKDAYKLEKERIY